MKRNGLLLSAAALALTMVGSIAQGQLIRLKTQVTVEARADVRLGDMATVTGADQRAAEELSNTIILSNIETTRTVKAESVLMALMAQRGAAGMGGSLQISGAAQCVVNVAKGGAPQKEAPVAMEAPKTTTAVVPAVGGAATRPVVVSASPTLTTVILERVRQETGRAADQLDITIDTISPLLDAPVAANRKWICRPLMRTLIGTVQFEAQLVEGVRTVEKLSVQTKIKWQQMAIVATEKLDRGDVITAAMVQVKEQWVDRQLLTLFTQEKDVIGLEAQRALDIGSLLDQRDFKQALMAGKGDPVSVIFLSGGLKVELRARATQDGKLHDQVQVRNEGTGEMYQAVLIGKRLAVVGGTLTAEEEKQLRDTR